MTAASAGSHHGLLYVLAMIVSGTLNTVFSKMQYGVTARGTALCTDPLDATRMTDECTFDKPWFGALLAKIGMSLSFVYVFVRHLQTRNRRRNLEVKQPVDTESSTLLTLPQDEGEQDSYDLSKLPLKTAAAIAWPSLLDLLQTLISNVGLLWVSSSVYQMARGSVIVFSALVSVHFLRKRLHGYHYASIAIVTLAVALVGWAGMPHETPTLHASVASSNALLGLALIIVAQFITAVQIVAEEYIMNELHVQPLVLVGVEGLWGLFFYVVLVPVLTLTPSSPEDAAIAKIWHEDFYDSVVKLSHSHALIVLSLLNIAAVAALGPSANYVTKHLSGVMRSIAEVLRTLGVWVVGLFVFYVVNWRGSNSPGEAWSVYSWAELLGFVLMVYGTLAYKRIIAMPSPVLYAGASTDEKEKPAAVELSLQKPVFA